VILLNLIVLRHVFVLFSMNGLWSKMKFKAFLSKYYQSFKCDDFLKNLFPSVLIIESYDVILLKIFSQLDFNNLKRDNTRIF
jgi:hypothetical protein